MERLISTNINKKMEDSEIYEISGEILSSITQDLNESIYTELGGNLSIAWSTIPTFNAWAESSSDIGEPPNHKIGIHYELVRQLYREIEGFCEFSLTKLTSSEAQKFFKTLDPEPPLPEIFTTEQCCFNMFIGALTFVYFHELGHLLQEHGYIRGQFQCSNDNKINEMSESASSSQLSGQAAAVSHATELAADYFATSKCISELLRQFNGDSSELRGAIYLFTCAISCIFHKFNSDVLSPPAKEPIGSHPRPLNRMEVNIPHIFELLVHVSEHFDHTFSRRELVHLCTTANISSTLYELLKHSPEQVSKIDLFLRGIQNKPAEHDYFRVIINTWDDIEKIIDKVAYADHPFNRLAFSDTIRKAIQLNE